jgi:hypothetical protein
MQLRRSESQAFDGQIAAEKSRLESEAALLGHGPDKEKLLKKIRQLDTASHMGDWLSSPGLRSPE